MPKKNEKKSLHCKNSNQESFVDLYEELFWEFT